MTEQPQPSKQDAGNDEGALPVDHMEGRLDAEYEVIKKVGKGGYALVYKGKRRSDGVTVAIKRVDVFDMSQRKRTRCFQEVKLFQGLQHKHVIRMFDAFIDQNQLIIVFEWAAGGDLKHLLRKTAANGTTLPEPEIWGLFLQCTLGLKYLHERKIMHRDIKPANVMVTGSHTLKLGDLGLGREFADEEIANGVVYSKVGTPYYVAPEVVSGEGYNWQSDIWSLGCLLYELANLTSPFEFEGAGIMDVFQKIRACEYTPLAADKWSKQLRSLQTRMIQLDPSKRPTISEIVAYCSSMAAPAVPAVDMSVVSQSLKDRLAMLDVNLARAPAETVSRGGAVPRPPRAALRLVHSLFFSHQDARVWRHGSRRLQLGTALCIVAWLLRLSFRSDHAQKVERVVEYVHEPSGSQRRQGADVDAQGWVAYAVDDQDACLLAAGTAIAAAAELGVDKEKVDAQGLTNGWGPSVCALMDMLLAVVEHRLQLPCAVATLTDDAEYGGAEAEEAIVDEAADMLIDAQERITGPLSDEQEDAELADLQRLQFTPAPPDANSRQNARANVPDEGAAAVMSSHIDASAWYMELERVAPHLGAVKISAASGAAQGWMMRHLEMQRAHARAIAGVCSERGLGTTGGPSPLVGIAKAIAQDLDRVETTEAALNDSLASRTVQLRNAQEARDRCQAQHITEAESSSALAQELADLVDTVEGMQADLEDAASGRSSKHPLGSMTKRIADLKEEMRQMDVRTGLLRWQRIHARKLQLE